MTKKTFEMIARVVGASDLDEKQKARLALDFALELKKHNDMFDVERFLEACLKEKKEK